MPEEEEVSIVEQIRISAEKRGQFYPVIRTNFGIAAGNTRLKANPAWTQEFRYVKTKYDHLAIMAVTNIFEEKPKEWWTDLLNQAAAELIQMGVEPGRIVPRLVEDFGLHERRIYRLLGKEYKLKTKPDKEKNENDNESISHADHRDPNAKSVSSHTSAHQLLEAAFAHYHLHPDNDYTEFQRPEELKCPGCGFEPGLDSDETKCPNDQMELQPKTYRPDEHFKEQKVIIEVEGKGSASKDNEKRDALFRKLDYKVVHLPNKMVEQYNDEIAALVAAFI